MLRNLGYLEEERNEQIRKENERRFQQEQQRINNVPPSQPKNNRWSIGSNPTLLPRATSSKTATTKTNSSNKTDGKEGK